jgi:hypothetical protein
MGKGVRFTLVVFALTPFVGCATLFMGEPLRIAASIFWSLFCTYWIVYYHEKWLRELDEKDRNKCVPSLMQVMTRSAGVTQRFFTKTREQVSKSGFITAFAKILHHRKH